MRWPRVSGIATLVLAVVLAGGASSAQVAVSTADINRLQELVFDIDGDIADIHNSREADQLRGELDLLREEVIYLKVKLRKERRVSRSEYAAVRDELQSLRSRVNAQVGTTGTVSPRTERERGPVTTRLPRAASPNEVPVGTEIDVRLRTRLDSETANVEDRFEATTVTDLSRGDRVLIPAGSVVRGIITSVDRASRTDRTASLTLSFDQISIRGRAYPIDATATQAFEGEGLRGEAERIGAGAAVGAIIGGILGGVKGALTGILIGAGGTIAATEGKDVELEAGTILRIRFDSPLEVK